MYPHDISIFSNWFVIIVASLSILLAIYLPFLFGVFPERGRLIRIIFSLSILGMIIRTCFSLHSITGLLIFYLFYFFAAVSILFIPLYYITSFIIIKFGRTMPLGFDYYPYNKIYSVICSFIVNAGLFILVHWWFKSVGSSIHMPWFVSIIGAAIYIIPAIIKILWISWFHGFEYVLIVVPFWTFFHTIFDHDFIRCGHYGQYVTMLLSCVRFIGIFLLIYPLIQLRIFS